MQYRDAPARRWMFVALVVGLVPVAVGVPRSAGAQAVGEEAFGDLNDTLMHYYLTSAYNVRQDLQRAKEYALRYDLPTTLSFGSGMSGQASGASDRDRTGFFLTFRGDKLYEGGGELDGGVDYLNVAYEFLTQDDGSMLDVHVGIAMIEYRLVGAELGQKYINMLGGFDYGIEDVLTFGADVSFNLATAAGSATAEHGDFDQLAAYADIPSLGAYGSFRFDLGSEVPRDAEVGKAFNFEKEDLGVLRFAYSQRFPYEITGLFFRDRFAEAGLPNLKLDGDQSGIVRWERVGPFDLGAPVLLSGGAALGTVPGVLRFAYLEANLRLGEAVGVYARGGAAYGRVQDETVAGYSAGVEVLWDDGAVVTRVGWGRRDWEVVDRVGSADRSALNIFVSGGWATDD